MGTHGCIQVDRIGTIEGDIRALASSTNGKLDNIWEVISQLRDQAATSRANWKWAGLAVGQLITIVMFLWKG